METLEMISIILIRFNVNRGIYMYVITSDLSHFLDPVLYMGVLSARYNMAETPHIPCTLCVILISFSSQLH